MSEIPPAEILREKALDALEYNPETGALTRKWSKHKRFIGKETGYITHHGYLRIHVFNTNIDAHRLIWLMVHGDLPDCEIDHINRNKLDNRISNLRLASQQGNQQNTGTRKDNSLGIKGVRVRESGKYQARVSLTDGSRLTKTFDDIASAVCWLSDVRSDSHGEFSHTPEQIEAEEREAFALNLVTEMGKDPEIHSRSMVQARKIYDLGYRKQGEDK